MIAIHSHGRYPGLEIVQRVWPGENPFQADRHQLLKATRTELGADGRDLNFNAYADNRSIFRYEMHTLPEEISEAIGTSTLLAAWNAAVYVAQNQRAMVAVGIQAISRRRATFCSATPACGSSTSPSLFRASAIEMESNATAELTTAPAGPSLDEERRGISALLAEASLELSSRDPAEIDACVGLLEPGTAVSSAFRRGRLTTERWRSPFVFARGFPVPRRAASPSARRSRTIAPGPQVGPGWTTPSSSNGSGPPAARSTPGLLVSKQVCSGATGSCI
jgi:hypothetical protein